MEMTLTIWMPLVELLDSTYLGYKKHVLSFYQKENISPVPLLEFQYFLISNQSHTILWKKIRVNITYQKMMLWSWLANCLMEIEWNFEQRCHTLLQLKDCLKSNLRFKKNGVACLTCLIFILSLKWTGFKSQYGSSHLWIGQKPNPVAKHFG